MHSRGPDIQSDSLRRTGRQSTALSPGSSQDQTLYKTLAGECQAGQTPLATSPLAGVKRSLSGLQWESKVRNRPGLCVEVVVAFLNTTTLSSMHVLRIAGVIGVRMGQTPGTETHTLFLILRARVSVCMCVCLSVRTVCVWVRVFLVYDLHTSKTKSD